MLFRSSSQHYDAYSYPGRFYYSHLAPLVTTGMTATVYSPEGSGFPMMNLTTASVQYFCHPPAVPSVVQTPAPGTILTPGTYRIDLAAADLDGVVGRGTTVVRVLPPWRQVNFPGDFGNPLTEATIWGWNADPDHDGLTNLQEYRFGSDPNNPASRGSVRVAAFPHDGTLNLQLSYLRRLYDPTILYTPEASPDLINWTSGIGVTQEVFSDIVYPGGEMESVTTEAVPTTVLPPIPRYYLRLRTSPAPGF